MKIVRQSSTFRFTAVALVVLAAGAAAQAQAGGSGSARAAESTCFGKVPTLIFTGPGYHDGTPEDDVIVADPESIVRAGAGDDSICGSGRVSGDDGDDRILYSETELIPPPPEGFNSEYIYGGDGDDTILATGAMRRMVLVGGGGNDVIRFRSEGQVLGAGGNDQITQVNTGPEGLPVNRRSNINGGAGDDLLRGGGGRDLLYGSEGDDTLVGGPGRDRFNGGNGLDTCFDTRQIGPGRACPPRQFRHASG